MAYGYDKNKYNELAKASITDKRNVVISSNSNGGYTIAQQTMVEEDGKQTWLFYKGAIYVKDLEHLYNIRDCINIAIQKVEEKVEEDKAWDDAANE